MQELKITQDMTGKVIKTKEDFIVYKRVQTKPTSGKKDCHAIAILLIPAGSKIVVWHRYDVNGTGDKHSRKLRTNKAICIGLIPFERGFSKIPKYLDLNIKRKFLSVYRQQRIEYRVGKLMEPVRSMSHDVYDQCRSGIHFFTNVEDAEQY